MHFFQNMVTTMSARKLIAALVTKEQLRMEDSCFLCGKVPIVTVQMSINWLQCLCSFAGFTVAIICEKLQ